MRDSLVYRSVAETHVNIVLCQYTKWVREDIKKNKTGDAQLHIAANPFNMKTAPEKLKDLIKDNTDATMNDQIHLYNPATSPDAILELGKAFHTYPLMPFEPNDKLEFTIPVFQLKIMERIINGFEEKGGANRVAMEKILNDGESDSPDGIYERRKTKLLDLVGNVMKSTPLLFDQAMVTQLCNPTGIYSDKNFENLSAEGLSLSFNEHGAEFKKIYNTKNKLINTVESDIKCVELNKAYNKGIESIDTFVFNIKDTLDKRDVKFNKTYNKGIESIDTFVSNIKGTLGKYGGVFTDVLTLNLILSKIPTPPTSITVYVDLEMDDLLSLNKLITHIKNTSIRLTVVCIRDLSDEENTLGPYVMKPLLGKPNVSVRFLRGSVNLEAIREQYGFYFPQLLPPNITPLIEAKKTLLKSIRKRIDEDEYNLCNSK